MRGNVIGSLSLSFTIAKYEINLCVVPTLNRHIQCDSCNQSFASDSNKSTYRLMFGGRKAIFVMIKIVAFCQKPHYIRSFDIYYAL